MNAQRSLDTMSAPASAPELIELARALARAAAGAEIARRRNQERIDDPRRDLRPLLDR